MREKINEYLDRYEDIDDRFETLAKAMQWLFDGYPISIIDLHKPFRLLHPEIYNWIEYWMYEAPDGDVEVTIDWKEYIVNRNDRNTLKTVLIADGLLDG